MRKTTIREGGSSAHTSKYWRPADGIYMEVTDHLALDVQFCAHLKENLDEFVK